MTPILYSLPAAPPVRAVLLCAKALNVQLEERIVNLIEGEQHRNEFLKINPNHTVPTLVDDDLVLWDSHSILGYLVGKYGKSDSLYPKLDVKRRALIDQQLHFDSGTFFPRGVFISRSIIYHGAKTIPEDNKESLLDAYRTLEKNLQGKKYVAGDDMSIADFSLISCATSWNLLVPIGEDNFPNLNSWMEKMMELPYYAEANGQGLLEYKKLIYRNFPTL